MYIAKDSELLDVQKHFHVSIPKDAEVIEGMEMKELMKLRNDLHTKLGTLIDKAERENRDMGDAEDAWATGMACVRAIDYEIDKRKESGSDAPRNVPEEIHKLNCKMNRGVKQMNENIFTQKKNWRDIFNREPRVVGSINDFASALTALHYGDDEQLRHLRTLNTITGAEGGYSVPEQTWASIYDSGVEQSVTLDKVTMFPMTNDTLYIAAWDSSDHTTGCIGAVQGSWLGEGQAATRVTPKQRVLTYYSHKLAMYIAATAEVLQDGQALANSLLMLMRNSLAFSLDEVILTGSGIARPTGILNSNATVSVSRSIANQIVFADLAGMMGRLLPSSLNNSVWLVSPSAFAELVGLVTETSSGNLVMSYNGATNLSMQILGRPVRITEKLPSLGTKGDLCLCDLSYYGLAMREAARFEKTNAAQWTSDIMDFRLIIRCDGRPLINNPFTPAGGGSTLSPFVVLG